MARWRCGGCIADSGCSMASSAFAQIVANVRGHEYAEMQLLAPPSLCTAAATRYDWDGGCADEAARFASLPCCGRHNLPGREEQNARDCLKSAYAEARFRRHVPASAQKPDKRKEMP